MNTSSPHPRPSSRAARLQALLDATQKEPNPSTAQRFLRDYGFALIITFLCAVMICLGEPSSRGPLLALLTIIFTLHGVSEQRSQRRFDQIQDALRDLSSQKENSDEPNA